MHMHIYTRLRLVLRRFLHNDLPLGGARFVLLLLLMVFSIVGNGLCLKIWTKHHHSQKLLDASLPPGVAATLEYSDVKTASILLFVAHQFVTLTSSHIILAMVEDIFHLLPPSLVRRMRLPAKPASSVTLAHQAWALLLSTVCLSVAAGFLTAFVFTRSGRVTVHRGAASTVQSTLDSLGIALPYRDVEYIRIAAELAWPAVFFALPSTAVTLVAWYKYRRAEASIRSVDSEAEVEKVIERESESEGKDDIKKATIEMDSVKSAGRLAES
ncbi:hypothetical protein B0H10DRAFT_2073943 [Mycena sp. CBHHK59/15]|nr:hypothetical protein B0H10DRAFT_2073943 [Mycena sp. CBHHK59/15]